jgi:hypothetical protein
MLMNKGKKKTTFECRCQRIGVEAATVVLGGDLLRRCWVSIEDTSGGGGRGGGRNRRRPRRRPTNTVVPTSEESLLAARRGRQDLVDRVAAVASWWPEAPRRQECRTAPHTLSALRATREASSTRRRAPCYRRRRAPANKTPRRRGLPGGAVSLASASMGRRWPI